MTRGDHPAGAEGNAAGAGTQGPAERGGATVTEVAGADEQVFAVDVSTVRTVADLLEMLGDLPSTPRTLAGICTARAGDLTRLLPTGGATATLGHGSIDLSATLLAAVAGLLGRLSELPSTPPVVADDAHSWASQLWERLEEPEPPPGHGQRPDDR